MAETEYSLNVLYELSFAPSGSVVNFTNVTVLGITATGSTAFYYQNSILPLPAGNTSFYMNTTSLTMPPAAGNTVIGVGAGNSITTGTNDTILGYNAGLSLTSGSNNTFLGMGTGQTITSGSFNTLSGALSGSAITTGSGNTMLGYQTGLLTQTGSYNTFFGYQAGALHNVTGNYITCIGAFSNPGSDGLVQATAIGANATVLLSHTVQVGQAGTDNVYIGQKIYINAVQLTDSNGHISSGTGTPGISTSAGSGTTATASVVGNSISGIISITTGSTVAPTGSSIVATVTFATSYGTPNPVSPRVMLTPANANAAAIAVASTPYVISTSSTNFVIQSNASPLGTGVSYQWYYQAAA
jgi:hypothetical protein